MRVNNAIARVINRLKILYRYKTLGHMHKTGRTQISFRFPFELIYKLKLNSAAFKCLRYMYVSAY